MRKGMRDHWSFLKGWLSRRCHLEAGPLAHTVAFNKVPIINEKVTLELLVIVCAGARRDLFSLFSYFIFLNIERMTPWLVLNILIHFYRTGLKTILPFMAERSRNTVEKGWVHKLHDSTGRTPRSCYFTTALWIYEDISLFVFDLFFDIFFRIGYHYEDEKAPY